MMYESSDLSQIRLLSKSEAAKLMGIGKDSLSKLIDQGLIGLIKVNGRFKIPAFEIKRYLSENLTYFRADDNGFVVELSDNGKKSKANNLSDKEIINEHFFNQKLNEVIHGKCFS